MAKPVMLIILDGWGIREMETGNAVKQAKTPNFNRWLRDKERAIVHTSGEYVGLVPDQMGNSEVGHLNLGAGRVVYQDITRIDNAIRDGSLANSEALVTMIEKVRANNGKLHLIGLLGPGGVHSHQDHLHALLEIASLRGVDPVIHVITDGRDTPPTSGIRFLDDLQAKIDALGVGRIATVSGRYYAMDRDKRWERTQQAYNAMIKHQAYTAASAHDAVQQSYNADVTDEFIVPVVIGDDDNLKVEPGDAMIFYNFRADRMRQIVKAFVLDDFAGADYFEHINDLDVMTFTEYEEGLPVQVLFPVDNLNNTLAEWISTHDLKQYHSAETEKYPHVTFFFNGRIEDPWPGEDRKIVPSPKVATYDLQPEMSAPALTSATLERLASHDDDFMLINFANPDMVGHTGSLEAAIKAVECVDDLCRATGGKGRGKRRGRCRHRRSWQLRAHD